MQINDINEILEVKPHTLATQQEQDRVAEVVKLIQGNVKTDKREVGQLRRKFITREYPTVRNCGHKLNPQTVPTQKNCNDCWHVYFACNEELVKETLATFTGKTETAARQAIINTHGIKWYKAFERFVVGLVAQQAEKQLAEAAETKEQAPVQEAA